MKIVADGLYNIEKGLEKVHELEKLLAQSWGHKLEDLKVLVENERQEIYQSKLSSWEKENQQNQERIQSKIKKSKIARIWLTIIFLLLLLGAPLIFLTSNIMFNVGSLEGLAETAIWLLVLSSPAIVGFLLISPLVFLGLWIQERNMDTKGRKGVPKPAIGNVSFTVPETLDLESTWWERLSRSPRPIRYNHGSQGEQILLKYLNESVLSDYICIINLMVGNKLDADLVLIGPYGVWILESKYISGVIRLNKGVWSREKSFYAPGGYLRSKMDYLGDIEDQWIRERKAVEITINKSLPSISNTHPSLVNGGLVFTHNRSRIIVDSDSSVPWGNIIKWVSVINNHKDNNGRSQESSLTKSQILKIADVLLERSRKINPSQTRSSIDIASAVYNDRKRGIAMLSEQYGQNLEPHGPINKAISTAEGIEKNISM